MSVNRMSKRWHFHNLLNCCNLKEVPILYWSQGESCHQPADIVVYLLLLHLSPEDSELTHNIDQWMNLMYHN